jgi:squalene cyclase
MRITNRESRIAAILTAAAIAGCGAERVRERPVDDAVREGVAYLVRSQNPDGSWGHAGDTTGFDVYAPIPGSHHAFRGATTALAVMGLRASGLEEGRAAADRGVDWLVANTDVRRHDGNVFYNVWAHTFALQALAGEYARSKDERLAKAAAAHVRGLERYETMHGGWNYYDFSMSTQTPSSSGTSFGTGAGVVALADARAAGLPVTDRLVERGLRVLQRCRTPEGAYLYDLDFRYYPMHPANRTKGSLGRAQAPNCALWMSGRLLDADAIRAGLEAMFREHRFLECGRKRQFPHEAYYFNSGYYYYYGHYYAARLVSELPAGDRANYAQQVLAGVLPFQEPDGSWWDYRMYGYHKAYGTALALMTIARLQ